MYRTRFRCSGTTSGNEDFLSFLSSQGPSGRASGSVLQQHRQARIHHKLYMDILCLLSDIKLHTTVGEVLDMVRSLILRRWWFRRTKTIQLGKRAR